MEATFIRAQKVDLPFIVAVYNQNIASKKVTADLKPVTLSAKESWFNNHDAKRPLWLIKIEQQKVGWVSLESFYGRPAYHATVEISIYIDRHFQHRGLGKETLAFIAKQTEKLGIHTILAYIFSINTASQKLFTAAGYEKYGHLPQVADMDGQIIDLDILGKKF